MVNCIAKHPEGSSLVISGVKQPRPGDGSEVQALMGSRFGSNQGS